MKHSKHGLEKNTKRSKKSKKKIVFIIIFLILLITIIFFVLTKFLNVTKEPENEIENIVTEEPPVEEPQEPEESPIETVDVSNMPNTIQGYTVIGKIVIEKLGVEKNILGRTTLESLNLGVTKFWGPHINDPGNFCITGHDYKNTFGRLKELEIGDTFYLIGKDGRKVTYEVNEKIPEKNPTDMSHIEQNEDGIRRVTLITCDQRRTHKVCNKSRTKKRIK